MTNGGSLLSPFCEQNAREFTAPRTAHCHSSAEGGRRLASVHQLQGGEITCFLSLRPSVTRPLHHSACGAVRRCDRTADRRIARPAAARSAADATPAVDLAVRSRSQRAVAERRRTRPRRAQHGHRGAGAAELRTPRSRVTRSALEDGRLALFLPVRAPNGEPVGIAMILADRKSVSDDTLERMTAAPVRAIMQRLAVLLKPSERRASGSTARVPMLQLADEPEAAAGRRCRPRPVPPRVAPAAAPVAAAAAGGRPIISPQEIDDILEFDWTLPRPRHPRHAGKSPPWRPTPPLSPRSLSSTARPAPPRTPGHAGSGFRAGAAEGPRGPRAAVRTPAPSPRRMAPRPVAPVAAPAPVPRSRA